MRIKLRDMTYEQYEKRFSKKGNCDTCALCPFVGLACKPIAAFPWTTVKFKLSDEFLDKEIEIESEPILTKEERKYLKNVIAPFRDKIAFIMRFKSAYHCGREIIRIVFKEKTFHDITLSKTNNTFQGMETKKHYTLKELKL